MKTHVDCIPCFLRQSLEAARMASKETKVQESLMKDVMQYLQTISYAKSPPEISKEVHCIIRKNTGSLDPYKEVKQQSNKTAEELYPSLKKQVAASKDPLFAALHLSIVGNVIDFGTSVSYTHLTLPTN